VGASRRVGAFWMKGDQHPFGVDIDSAAPLCLESGAVEIVRLVGRGAVGMQGETSVEVGFH